MGEIIKAKLRVVNVEEIVQIFTVAGCIVESGEDEIYTITFPEKADRTLEIDKRKEWWYRLKVGDHVFREIESSELPYRRIYAFIQIPPSSYFSF